MTSTDPENLKYTEIVVDGTGSETYYFHEYFKGEASSEKKEKLDDMLKFFAARNKKVCTRKKRP